ncbi:MAG: hypothetical protein IPL65_22065 [Lewinellaceae bacterium]|nr:hypothetical protein [Lewinellaceae bacterium]
MPQPVQPKFTPNSSEMVCGFAGTFQLGAFAGQSNDAMLDTIYLCFGDSIFIDHNGDSDLTGDPNPATPAGIGWAFYNCPPTIIGDNLQTVLTDPCLTPGAANGIWIAFGQPSGDIQFVNNGSLQTAFNGGQPVLLHFAPITVDNFAAQAYESGQPGFPPGPCVNVNTAAEFSVVYLNAITASGISTAYLGNDCLGKFRVRGGFPEYSSSSTYTISITLASDPNVKAVIHTQQSQLFHSADVIFSVPQAGTYNVVVEDGKSCGHTFQITMGTCNPSDNVVLTLPNATTPVGSQICIPITTTGFNDVVGASFSLTWDPNVLQFTGFQNIHPLISEADDDVQFNQNQVGSGRLGMLYYNALNNGATIPAGETLFEVCFNALGQLGECSPLNILNSPTAVQIENSLGIPLAVSVDTGSICIANQVFMVTNEIIDTTCLGTAAIQVTATGGNAPFQVIWQQIPTGANANASILNSGGTYTTPQLQAGTYEIRVTDADGFGTLIADTVVINIPILGASLDLSLPPLCNNQCSGIITANVFVGSTQVPPPAGPDFGFTWTANAPMQGMQVQNGVCAGNYGVTITQASTGCTATASGTLGQPAAVGSTNIQLTPATCSGVSDGSITFTASGGTPFPGNFYNFDWTFSESGNPPFAQAGSGTGNPYFLSGLSGGYYQVTVTDMNGCTYTNEVQVSNALDVSIDTISVNNVSCFGLGNGDIAICVTEFPASLVPTILSSGLALTATKWIRQLVRTT